MRSLCFNNEYVLCVYVFSIECDGVEISARVREAKFHCILFHNIKFYAGGTVPWGTDPNADGAWEEFTRPSCSDGKIEVGRWETGAFRFCGKKIYP